MNLKEKLQSSYLAFEDHLQADSPLHDVRNKAMKSFETKGFPSKKRGGVEIHISKCFTK
jgi:Fe-S cluster assembly protein SufD